VLIYLILLSYSVTLKNVFLCACPRVLTEQKRLTEAYSVELCSVLKTRGWDCEDMTLKSPLLNIPVVPCNFIPLDAQLYSGIHAPSHHVH